MERNEMQAQAGEQVEQVVERKKGWLPRAFTASTYFWTPGRSAADRRRAEKRHHEEFERWIAEFGDLLAAHGIEVEFSYSESCRHVYKHVRVWRNGKRSNLSIVKRLLNITE